MLSLSPPTDNLYKFMAIIGLVLLLGGATYPWIKAYDLNTKVIEFSAVVEQAKRSKVFDDIDLNKNLQLEKLAYSAWCWTATMGVAAMLVGIVLTYNGFKLWYYRVQKPLDEELASKATQTQR